jgi:hypothetical protein
MELTSTLEWELTLLAMHVLMLIGVVAMIRGAPCWLQRTALTLLGGAAVVFCVAYAAALANVASWQYMLLVAFVLEHIAVLIYVFRINWQGGRYRGTIDRPATEVR